MSLKDLLTQTHKVGLAHKRVNSVLSAMQALSKQQGSASIETLNSTRLDLEKAAESLEVQVAAFVELIFQRADKTDGVSDQAA